FVETYLTELNAHSMTYVSMLAVVLSVTLTVALFVTFRFQQVISAPLLRLTDVIRRVQADGKYDVRAVAESEDQIGELIHGFNDMLVEIQRRDRELVDHRSRLEGTVSARTAELR